MQSSVFSCFTACPTKVSPFVGTTLAPCRGCSMVNTLILETKTRNSKCLTSTDSCHPMPVHSTGAEPLRRVDVVVSTLYLSRSDLGASSHPSREQGKVDVATPCHAPVISGCSLCETKLWLYRRGAHSTTPALHPGQRGLQARALPTCIGHSLAPARHTGMAQLRKAVALAMLVHHLPEFVFCICTDAFSDTAAMVKVDCQKEPGV